MTTKMISPTAGRRVLLVEDEPRLREMLTGAISDMGFSAEAARSAEAAQRMIDIQSFDIAMLDLNLPGMRGIEFFELLRRKFPQIQVIVLTGFGDLESAKQAIRLNVSDFLTKPCALGDLEVALERARQRCPHDPPAALVDPEDSPIKFPPAEPLTTASSQEGTHATLEEVERQHILATLDRNQGNRSATAAELGISLRTLYYRLGQYHQQGLI